MNQTPALRLEPFVETDVGVLLGWMSDERFHFQWTGPGFAYPLDAVRMKAHVLYSRRLTSTSKIYKGLDPGGRMIAYGEIAAINPLGPSATLARLLVGPPEARGQGYGTALVENLTRIAFEELSLHRLDLRVFDFNGTAIRCYEKAGFQKEGLMRQACRVGQEHWNACIMSLLAPEWRARRG